MNRLYYVYATIVYILLFFLLFPWYQFVLDIDAISYIHVAQRYAHGDYYAAVNEGRLPVKKGYKLNKEDRLFRKNILDISCKGETIFNHKQSALLEQFTFPELESFAKENLVKYDKSCLHVTEQGHPFIRNICSAFDMHLHRVKSINHSPSFSKAI